MARRDPEATREAILDAALQVFAQKGFAETSTSALAAEAGVTKSLIHHHFGSKEALWDALKQREFVVYHEAQKALLEQEPAETLMEASVRLYFRVLKDRPEFRRLLTWMALESDASCRVMGTDLIELGVARLVDAQARGLVRADIAAPHILLMFFSLVEHWFLLRGFMAPQTGLCCPEDDADDEHLEGLIRVFLQGIEPRP